MIERIDRNDLVVGVGNSKIAQSIASVLAEQDKLHGKLITTSHQKSHEFMNLDILNIDSIKKFIDNYLEKYGKQKLNSVFLNSGFMNKGKSLGRHNVIKKINDKDYQVNLHFNNIILLERLSMAGIIDNNTKVIYNASIQIFDSKEGYEDYAYMKKLVSELIINDDHRNPTILCLSLVKGTTMESLFKEEKGEDSFNEFISKNMEDGQPSLGNINNVVTKILEDPQGTKGKFVLLDGGILMKNNPEIINDDFLFYDKEKDALIPCNKNLY
ncbi:MAG: hypothetical protein CR971_01870 [candidate division SR1 bacterium]|nr:MAG: hypothetical protein CR971_01870 [candidate division SR1 bacterium]